MCYAKRILAFLLFMCGLYVFLIVASHLFMPKNNMSESGMENASANGILGENANTIDVLVIGDSESYAAITPMQLWKEKGYTSYVCGTSAQTLDYSLTLVKRSFQKQKPKLVILETNAIYRKLSGSAAVLREMGNLFPVFSYHNRWKTLSRNDLKWSADFTWTDDHKGYHYSSEVNGCEKKDHMISGKKTAEIPGLNLQYVRKIKKFCEANGAKVLFLSTPSPVNWNDERHKGIATLAKELVCEYIDLNLMNDTVQIDWTKDTRDKGDHLNHAGAKKVTHYLADYLSHTGLLQDHRGDPEYEKWNEALKKYEAACGEA